MSDLPWRLAMESALYGEGGFYRRGAATAEGFRTSVTAGSAFAGALARLLTEVDEALGRPDPLDAVDVGAGQGELLVALRERAPAAVRRRLRLHGVEVAERPRDLPRDVAWSRELPVRVEGLLVANEWLDNVPVDVVVRAGEGLALVLVDPATGQERVGGAAGEADLAWLREWWPMPAAAPGDRAEVGRLRDEAWARAVRSLRRGVAVAVDYAHDAHDAHELPQRGRPAGGTLTGYRGGRQVAPVPDGSCDLTAHVALDACAAAAERARAGVRTVLTTQREALRALGLDARRPPRELAGRDPRAYVAALSHAAEVGELTARGGLGDFGWLVQAVGVGLPASLAALSGPSRAATRARG